MISLSNYRDILSNGTLGEIRKHQSDMIMEETWWNDIAAKKVYLYDWEHDTHRQQLINMNPLEDTYKVAVDAKFIVHTSQTYEKDNVTFHLQLRPSQDFNCVPYYEEVFHKRYDATFPVGLYADIQDARGIWNRWLVVATADINNPQFPKYEILRCDKIINYIFDGKKYFVPSVLRSQNSYNSGLWTDYKITITEDVQKFIAPMNRETEKIYYNQRIIIDNHVLTEPRCWHVSKVNRVNSNGVCLITLAQDMYNPSADYLDSDGWWWADYYQSNGAESALNESEVTDTLRAVITCAGSQNIKVGGSYKKYSVDFFNNDIPTTYFDGAWTCLIDGNGADAVITTSYAGLENNQIKIKFIGNDSYIGKILTVRFVSNIGIVAEFETPIVSL